MSNKRVVWTNPDGSVSVLIPAPGVAEKDWMKDIPIDAINPTATVAEDIPSDRTFRKAWKVEGRKCVECPVKSKEVAHEIRRAKRAQEFAPHDDIVSKQLPGKEQAEQARQAIRDKYAVLQEQIDSAQSVEELKQLLK